MKQTEHSRGRRAAAALTRAVGMTAIPEDDRALSSLPDADYADTFSMPTHADASPERWARAMFGDIPSPAQRFIWRRLLGLRLMSARSPHTVAGWRIAERGERWIRLETESRLISANLVVRTSEGRVALTTFVRYDRGVGRILWTVLSLVHRRLVPGVLRDAVKACDLDQSRRAAALDRSSADFGHESAPSLRKVDPHVDGFADPRA
ncbi:MULTISPECIES: DUF2867 domain-containing protein [unclassified Microbacterium]|uniref:DUF2867 domain-containing protein n=1 Tax=unclassified Microbacterium TaxID=2609290 RepID=UPI000EAA826B|nr:MULTISPECIES: DUF2867 domain-containing protein [unclassified Microbacterium]MBT2483541.1 DUF2867 domain-containing protein [Microbacterium sp. ISL-108]RKN66554.1 DUF2867 domain-containing protein [Microbacterium sp. CGR2]